MRGKAKLNEAVKRKLPGAVSGRVTWSTDRHSLAQLLFELTGCDQNISIGVPFTTGLPVWPGDCRQVFGWLHRITLESLRTSTDTRVE